MKLRIIDQRWAKEVIIKDATMIPRKGDLVEMGYSPNPEVKYVWWNFDKGIVTIVVE
jgi:hypothetical protein